jgi:4-hydroxy-tetrahydrodipicolinate synthase
MCAAALAGDAAGAEKIDSQLRELHRTLFLDPNPIPVKWALNRMGKIPAGLRLPLVAMNPRHEEAVSAALRAAGALE